jgi:uncharacterized protein YggU (UPF0235/DUF167 family)
MTAAIEPTATGIRLLVRLTPRGGRDEIGGWAVDAAGKPHLKARVAAAPEDGKANKALTALLAKHLGVANSAVRIVRGETSRLKLVAIEGNRAALTERLKWERRP